MKKTIIIVLLIGLALVAGWYWIEGAPAPESGVNGTSTPSENGSAENGSEEEEPEEMTVSVYWLLVEDGQEEVVEAKREIERTEAPARAVLELLLAGPEESELEAGYSTAINEGVEILDLTIEDEMAQVNLSGELEEEVAGSARVTAIREQIEQTLLQFPTVQEVEIAVEGQSEGILQP